MLIEKKNTIGRRKLYFNPKLIQASYAISFKDERKFKFVLTEGTSASQVKSECCHYLYVCAVAARAGCNLNAVAFGVPK